LKQEEYKQPLIVDADDYMPINAINTFTRDLCFKARVIKKPALRSYKNDKGEGKILTIDLIDKEGT
jgi:hypothetical protein